MARALRIQYPGAYYHVTCRGNDRRAIYRDDHDRKLFKEKLKQSMEIYDIVLQGLLKLRKRLLICQDKDLALNRPKPSKKFYRTRINADLRGGGIRRQGIVL